MVIFNPSWCIQSLNIEPLPFVPWQHTPYQCAFHRDLGLSNERYGACSYLQRCIQSVFLGVKKTFLDLDVHKKQTIITKRITTIHQPSALITNHHQPWPRYGRLTHGATVSRCGARGTRPPRHSRGRAARRSAEGVPAEAGGVHHTGAGHCAWALSRLCDGWWMGW